MDYYVCNTNTNQLSGHKNFQFENKSLNCPVFLILNIN